MQCAPSNEITGIVYALPVVPINNRLEAGQLIVYTDRVMAVGQINSIRLSSSYYSVTGHHLLPSFKYKLHFFDCTRQGNGNGNDAKGYPPIRQKNKA